MGGEDVVGEDLGGAGGGLQQADGALNGVRGQGRAGAGDVDELGEQDDDGVDAGCGAGDGDGGAAHVDVDVGEALLDGAQDLVPGAQEGHRGDVLRQGEGARNVRRFGGGDSTGGVRDGSGVDSGRRGGRRGRGCWCDGRIRHLRAHATGQGAADQSVLWQPDSFPPLRSGEVTYRGRSMWCVPMAPSGSARVAPLFSGSEARDQEVRSGWCCSDRRSQRRSDAL